MKHVTCKHVTVDGRAINIIDGAVDFSERESIYSFLRHSAYHIGNEDADAIETAHHKYMCSYFSQTDVDNLKFLEYIRDTPAHEIISGKLLTRAHVNLSTPTDCHWAHDHRGQIGLLYYANKHWKHDWAGETVFFTDDLSEVAYASVYKPGRIIIFDGEIPHSVRPQSSIAPTYRLTLSLFFNR